MSNSTALFISELSSRHDTGSHPENERRIDAVRNRLSREGVLDDRAGFDARPVDEPLIYRVHDADMIEETRAISDADGGFIDADTYVSSGSFEAALAAAGSAVQAIEYVANGDAKRAFSIARPPGHHAERRRQCGFCLFNNIAIAAQHGLDSLGFGRIAIIDWDVHHGNGTQDIFYSSNDVLFCSTHQWPLFPGTGRESERGSGDGEGYTINVPLPPGSTDGDYLIVFDEIFAPAVRDFQPDLIMCSAGFDAHRDDPLAMMSVTERGFGRMANRVRSWADKLCDGQIVLVLEGGYNLRALADSVVSVLRVLDSSQANEREST